MSDYTKEQIDIMAENHFNVYDPNDPDEMQEFVEDYLEDGVITAEPTQNFIDACIEIRKTRIDDDYDNCTITVLEKTQRHKGETRCDLLIFDFGDKRVVFKS